MSDRINEFPSDLLVVIVTFTPQQYLAGYRDHLGLDFTFVSDRSRRTYQSFGFGKAPWWRVWGPKGVMAWINAWSSAQTRIRPPNEDTLQLGGNVIVKRDGTIGAIYRPTGSHDRPSIETLVAACR
ncbi:MAG: hypothetical protein ACI8Y4_001152 [Candidatus Poriferisodalaceae bacterium]